MLSIRNLRQIANNRFGDAKVLFEARRYSGAFYLCGYAVELRLKARICRTLKWQGYPESNKEFQKFQSFKTHDLTVLLQLGGIENKIKTDTNLLTAWSIILNWDPEKRYQPIPTVDRKKAKDFLDATQILLRMI